jgi:hypothetical protein
MKLSSPLDLSEPTERYHLTLAVADHEFIRLIVPKRSSLAHVLNLLLKKFIHECRTRSIIDSSRREDFIDLVNRCTITCSDRSTVVDADGRSTEATDTVLSGPTSDNPSPQVVNHGRGRGRGTNTKAKEGQDLKNSPGVSVV